MYEERTYRNLVSSGDLVGFQVIVKETDLFVRAKRELSLQTRESVLKYRYQIENYISQFPYFEKSLVPIEDDPFAPMIVREMITSCRRANVGPMAAVAGAIAEFVGRDLLSFTDEVVVENGGDIFIQSARERTVAVYAGKSPLSFRIGILIKPEDSPLGICTSSGTVGHSLSFGRADSVTVISKSAALADAAATAIGNMVKDRQHVESALETGRQIEGVTGIMIILGDRIGVWGNIKLVDLGSLQ